MLIDDKTHVLPIQNYIQIESKKEQIIIGNTFNHDMRHYNGWLKRYNGHYKKTAAFTISSVGLIYKHFDPKFYSNYFKDYQSNSKSIVILLENDGWLIKNSENNEFITWIGDIYKGVVFERKWRDYYFWQPYTEKQIETLGLLCKQLFQETSVKSQFIGHNTKISDFQRQEGVVTRSNYDVDFTDVSPAFSFEGFIKQIENE